MCSHEIKKFQMERQTWDRNRTSIVSMGIGHRNNKKDPVRSDGMEEQEELENTSC